MDLCYLWLRQKSIIYLPKLANAIPITSSNSGSEGSALQPGSHHVVRFMWPEVTPSLVVASKKGLYVLPGTNSEATGSVSGIRMTRKATNPAFRISILSRSDGRRRSPAVDRRTLPDTNAPNITSAIPLPLANPEINNSILNTCYHVCTSMLNLYMHNYYENDMCA